jgi:hypothetical protein
MANVPVVSNPGVEPASARRAFWRLRKLPLFAGGVALVVLLGVGVFADAHWPYRYRVVKPLLEDVLGSQIEITRYHRTYFPHPGFVADGLTLRRKSALNLSPIGSVEQLAVQGTWADLLMLRPIVRLVDMQSLRIVIPAPGSGANREDFPPGSASDFAGPDTLIEELKIHNGLLEIMRANGLSFSFPIKELDVRDFQKGRANQYVVDMQNAIPHGHIQSSGSFGPLNAQNLGATPVAGTFSFSSVRLQDIGDIRGTLTSSGRFEGSMAQIEATADSDTQDFAVGSGGPTPVHGSFRCAINGQTGEVVMHQVEVKSGTTLISASGAVVGNPKITNLDIAIKNGRAEDVLRPFVHGEAPIAGSLWLKGHASVGPTEKGVGFLQRLRVDGIFDVPNEQVTNGPAEKTLSDFSRRAQKNKGDSAAGDASDVLSAVKGLGQIRNGIASSPHLTFKVAGAQATLQGTFNFRDETVHLTGNLSMQSEVSHAETGFKSVLLKPLDPFLKKRHAGAVIPIAVIGGPGHYKVTQDFSHAK